MKILVCLIVLLWVGFAQAQEFPKEFEEPTIDKLIEWIPEQIPRTVSFYFDTDGDGVHDIIVAYFLIEAYACKEKCTIEVSEYDDHWILVSSMGSNPYSYYIIKRWSMWRLSDKDDWQSVEKTSGFLFGKYDKWYEERFLKKQPKKEN